MFKLKILHKLFQDVSLDTEYRIAKSRGKLGKHFKEIFFILVFSEHFFPFTYSLLYIWVIDMDLVQFEVLAVFRSYFLPRIFII